MLTIVKLRKVLPLVFIALGISAPEALALPPINDTFPNATPVTAGFSETIDTTEATTDGDDFQLNQSCGAPATDASLWYRLEGSGITIAVDVSQSNYSAGVLVGVGSQGDLQTVACGPGTVAFFAEAGTTYYVLAIDDQFDGEGNGGLLTILFNEVLAPTLSITVNRFGRVNTRTGVATISGTYTCVNGDFIEVFGEARQTVGRIATIVGGFFFFDSGTCDGEPHSWSADIVPQSGQFRGKTMTVTFAFSCGPFECADGFVERIVQLRGGGQGRGQNK
jgi:hypothetical protein